MIATNKRCSSCTVTKARSEFSKDLDRKDGLYYQCKQCKAAAARASYVPTRGVRHEPRKPRWKVEKAGTFNQSEKTKWARNLDALIERTRGYFRRPNLNHEATS